MKSFEDIIISKDSIEIYLPDDIKNNKNLKPYSIKIAAALQLCKENYGVARGTGLVAVSNVQIKKMCNISGENLRVGRDQLIHENLVEVVENGDVKTRKATVYKLNFEGNQKPRTEDRTEDTTEDTTEDRTEDTTEDRTEDRWDGVPTNTNTNSNTNTKAMSMTMIDQDNIGYDDDNNQTQNETMNTAMEERLRKLEETVESLTKENANLKETVERLSKGTAMPNEKLKELEETVATLNERLNKAAQYIKKITESGITPKQQDNFQVPQQTSNNAFSNTPTLEEVESYFKEKNLKGTATAFFRFYSSRGWKDSKGQPIKKWHSFAYRWEDKASRLNREELNDFYRKQGFEVIDCSKEKSSITDEQIIEEIKKAFVGSVSKGKEKTAKLFEDTVMEVVLKYRKTADVSQSLCNQIKDMYNTGAWQSLTSTEAKPTVQNEESAATAASTSSESVKLSSVTASNEASGITTHSVEEKPTEAKQIPLEAKPNKGTEDAKKTTSAVFRYMSVGSYANQMQSNNLEDFDGIPRQFIYDTVERCCLS